MKHACEKCGQHFDVAEADIVYIDMCRHSCKSPQCPRCPACGFAVHGEINRGTRFRDRIPKSYQEMISDE